MDEKRRNIKLIIIIAIIITSALTATYAFVVATATKETAATNAGCFVVDYTGTPDITNSLISTNDYTQGSKTSITLSKNADCKIYTTATIYMHTNTDATTAPLNETQALKYKIVSNNEELTEGVITTDASNNDKSLLTVTLSTTPKTYDVYIWVDSLLSQGTYNNTTYSGYIYASSDQTSTLRPAVNDYVEKVMQPIAVSDSNIDFSVSSNESNTNGIYIRSGTETDTHPIYYYRGNVNNNLIFADFCWKVVRTTETGGLKLLYNGVPTDGQCNNTGEATTIGKQSYNNETNSPAYTGYMYGIPYPADYRSITSSDQYVYGNGVTYSNGIYTLTNTMTDTWNNLYETGLPNHHYTCFSSGTTCESVYYIYMTDDTEIYYLTLTGVNNIETSLSQMLDNNTTSSTIKGNKDTEGTLDYWYYTNIEQKNYSSYIEDTVWCYDRSIRQLGGFNPNGSTKFGPGVRLQYTPMEKYLTNTQNPSLNCNRNVDRFTVNEQNGNGALDYPVGLLTSDEITLAGDDLELSNMPISGDQIYLNNKDTYWIYFPSEFSFDSGVTGIMIYGSLQQGADLSGLAGVRPSISLKHDFTLTGNGDGTTTNPYKVE